MMNSAMRISIVIPTLNEASGIVPLLTALQTLRPECEIIIADGGSQDGTRQLALPLADKIIVSARGRASQMNAGAMKARGDLLLFLHADTRLPDNAIGLIRKNISSGGSWGRFDIELTGNSPMFKVISHMMNWRSRLTSIATGDQALFITRKAFDHIGGYPDIKLMEDIAISKKLNKLGKPVCLKQKVISSGRRWEKFGLLRTILLMWWLRLLFFLGASPAYLSELYLRGIFWKR